MVPTRLKFAVKCAGKQFIKFYANAGRRNRARAKAATAIGAIRASLPREATVARVLLTSS